MISRNLKIEDLCTSSEISYKQYRKIGVGDLLICTKRWREIQVVTHVYNLRRGGSEKGMG